MAAALGRALGQEVRYNAVSPAAYSALGFPGADELANMFQFNSDFEDEYCAARDLDTSRRLHPGLCSYSEWLEQHAEQIPIGMKALQPGSRALGSTPEAPAAPSTDSSTEAFTERPRGDHDRRRPTVG